MSLEKRLEQLKRQNRRFKQGIVLAVVLAASALLAGAVGQLPSDISAHRFTLADPKEKMAISYLKVMKGGSPSLFFREIPQRADREKNGAATIDFRDRNGKVHLSMGVSRDGPPSFSRKRVLPPGEK